ncbi:hypothetical protein [Crocosphaera chwakensis]|uniref:hypothetical protein n=1 Tax=Crocosphaera chwakensis TaxID=2546361 RepID=UPI00055ABC67|nr:hypothetical protein [Crocosphaera chwakensis]
MKISLCDRCLFYSHNPHLICPVHPYGVHENYCLDFRQDPNKEEILEEVWSPEGYTFDNNGDLQPVTNDDDDNHPDGYILNYYDEELVVTKPSPYTQEELLELVDYHPIFTGLCPECKHKFNKKNPPLIHWDCPNCGWIDDSV